MKCRTLVPSAVVLLCLSAPVHAGSSGDSPSPDLEEAAAEPNAADLVREARGSEDWLYRIDSLQFRVEGTWTRPPESIAAWRAEMRKQDASRDPDPRYIIDLQPFVADSLEYAIDFRRQRLRYVENEPTRGQFLHIWDGNELAIHRRRPDGYEDYSRTLSKDPIDRIFGSLSWTKHRPHSFWWAPADDERVLEYMGRPERFRIVGRVPYRGVDCYLLEFEPKEGPPRTYRWYIGCDDHLLYGRTESVIEHWMSDYREVAPGCRMPMTQGYTIKYRDPNTKEPYVRVRRDAKIVDVRINEELSDALFQMEWKEGVYVMDERSGEMAISQYVAIPPSLLGKPLADVSSLGVDSTVNPPTNRSILLCFVDLNQRPSRHCLARIAADYERLGQQVAIVAADVSGMDEASLRRLSREEKIPFVIRSIGPDNKKMRQAWGIRSLPWLILADQDHIVRAEGFGLEELSARIKEVTNGRP